MLCLKKTERTSEKFPKPLGLIVDLSTILQKLCLFLSYTKQILEKNFRT